LFLVLKDNKRVSMILEKRPSFAALTDLLDSIEESSEKTERYMEDIKAIIGNYHKLD